MDAGTDILAEKDFLLSQKGLKLSILRMELNIQLLIKKSDGATLYITRDLAAALYRKAGYNLQIHLCCWSRAICPLQTTQGSTTETGYDWSQDIVHVPFGLVTKEMKTLCS